MNSCLKYDILWWQIRKCWNSQEQSELRIAIRFKSWERMASKRLHTKQSLSSNAIIIASEHKLYFVPCLFITRSLLLVLVFSMFKHVFIAQPNMSHQLCYLFTILWKYDTSLLQCDLLEFWIANHLPTLWLDLAIKISATYRETLVVFLILPPVPIWKYPILRKTKHSRTFFFSLKDYIFHYQQHWFIFLLSHENTLYLQFQLLGKPYATKKIQLPTQCNWSRKNNHLLFIPHTYGLLNKYANWITPKNRVLEISLLFLLWLKYHQFFIEDTKMSCASEMTLCMNVNPSPWFTGLTRKKVFISHA